ncbi:MAG: hypothetical protein P9M07_08385 [Candidatus Aceula meridiana]|nr:hypothetical protein [Candidatus Aceula meridiana]
MKNGKNQRLYFMIPLLLVLAFSLSGCFYAIIGGLGALGGYAISPDTVEGETQIEYDTLWDAAVEIVSIMGTIQTKNYKLGQIEARVAGAYVWVDLSQASSSWVRMSVKARKNMLPSMKTAQDVWVKVKNRVIQ